MAAVFIIYSYLFCPETPIQSPENGIQSSSESSVSVSFGTFVSLKLLKVMVN